MSDSDRRPVRVRRAPKVPVFLGLGVLVGIVAALIVTVVTPVDGQYPTSQVLGFLVLLLAPIGAVLGGVVAVVLDGVATRRARILEAERIAPAVDDQP